MKVLQFLKVNLSALFVLLSLAVFSTGCNDEDAATVSVSKEIILVGSDAQAIPVTIMSNANWTAESNASWVRVSKASGRGTADIEVLIEACTAVTDRSAMISVKAGGKTAIIDVTQNATAGLLVIAPDSMALGNQGGLVSFVIASNSPWTISSSNEWAVPSVTSGNGNATINVSVASNESHFVPRQATLSVTTGAGANAIVRTFTVSQLSRALPHITVAQKAVTFAANAKSARQNVVLIPIVSNVTGAISAHTDFNWHTVSVETLQGVKYVRIVCESDNNDNNNRDCIVNVIANVDGEATMAQIRVTQAGLGSPDIVLFRNIVALDCNAAALVPVNYYFPTGKNITVKAVSEEPKWITNVKVDASKKRVTFDVSANLTGETRVGTIMVTASIGTETQLYPITVTQAGVGEADVTVAPAALNLGALINLSATATVTSQTAYTGIAAVATDASWLTVEQLNETSNGASYAQDIKVTATPNALSGSRTATVTLTVRYGDKLVLRTISITQAGLGSPYITLLPSEVNVSSATHNAEGNDIVITYLAPSNVTFDAVSTTDWLKVHGIYENLNKIVLRIPTENKDEADRTGIVNVSVTRDGETVIYPVKVTQRGLGAIDVRIAPEVISLTADELEGQFVVSAQYAGAIIDAKVTSGSEWLKGLNASVTSTSGNSVTKAYTFTTEVNANDDSRTGTISVVTTWGNKTDVRTVTVVQNGLGAPAVSTVSTAYMLSDQVKHTQSLWIEDGNMNNVTYQVTGVSYQSGTNNGNAQSGWISKAYVQNNNLIIETQKNTGDYARDGEITIVASRGTSKAVMTVHVTQAGHLTAGMSNLPALITRDFNATSDIPLQFVMLNNSVVKEVYSSHPWLTVTKTSNNGITYSVTQYAGGETRDYREAYITILVENGNSNKAIYTIPVHQLSPEMPGILNLPELITRNYEATPTGPMPAAAPAFFSFYLQNNATLNADDIKVEYTSGTSTGWLSFPTTKLVGEGGYGLRTLYYHVTQFQGGEEGGFREAVISIPVGNSNANKVIYKVRVRQYAPEMPGILNLPTLLTYNHNAHGSSSSYIALPMELQNGATVTAATSSETWLTISRTGSDSKYTGVSYYLTAYTGGEDGNFRDAYISITVKNNHNNEAVYVVPVRQYAPEMPGIETIPDYIGHGRDVVTDATVVLNPINGATLSVIGYSDWVASASISGKKLTYSLKQNYAVESREGYIQVRAKNNNTDVADYFIRITQYGSSTLYVSPATVFVNRSSVNYITTEDHYRKTSTLSTTAQVKNAPINATYSLGIQVPANVEEFYTCSGGLYPVNGTGHIVVNRLTYSASVNTTSGLVTVTGYFEATSSSECTNAFGEKLVVYAFFTPTVYIPIVVTDTYGGKQVINVEVLFN